MFPHFRIFFFNSSGLANCSLCFLAG
jgi:hypothetical protein